MGEDIPGTRPLDRTVTGDPDTDVLVARGVGSSLTIAAAWRVRRS